MVKSLFVAFGSPSLSALVKVNITAISLRKGSDKVSLLMTDLAPSLRGL